MAPPAPAHKIDRFENPTPGAGGYFSVQLRAKGSTGVQNLLPAEKSWGGTFSSNWSLRLRSGSGWGGCSKPNVDLLDLLQAKVAQSALRNPLAMASVREVVPADRRKRALLSVAGRRHCLHPCRLGREADRQHMLVPRLFRCSGPAGLPADGTESRSKFGRRAFAL